MAICGSMYNKLIAYRLFLLFSLVCLSQKGLLADDRLTYGTPFIQNFTKKDYKAGNKNWSITQDDKGFIYVGNSNGLLQYDGVRWKKYNLPGDMIVRAVFADGDRIYCGSLGEFGYWVKDENFDLTYKSISNLLTNYEFGDEEIWWIVKFNNEIYFQSFANIFVYDGEKVEIVLSNLGTLFPPFLVNGHMYVQATNHGIFEITGRKSTLIPDTDILLGKRVLMMTSFSDSSSILIGTENHGLYMYSNNRIKKWNVPANQQLIANQLNRGVKINDRLFAVGTILGGVFILNDKGEIRNRISQESGLNNNTVLSLHVDKQNNLWVGLDNGIDIIKINSPIYYYWDMAGNIGSVYSAAIHDGYLFLGTNRGVFYTKFNPDKGFSNETFLLLPGSEGQIWNLSVIDNTLFCGHNNFTSIIDQLKMIEISDISGGYDFKVYPYDDNYLFQGAYNGLFVYKKDRDTWRFSHAVSGFNKLSKIIAFERENVVWISHAYKGLYRLELSPDFREVSELRTFSQNAKTFINILNNKIVFGSDSGFTYYDDIQNTFFSLEKINESLGEFAENARFIKAANDNYWIFKDGECERAVMDENKVDEIESFLFNDLGEYLIPGHENIYELDSIHTLVFLDNGFSIYHKNWKDWVPDYEPEIFLRQLEFFNVKGENTVEIKSIEEIPFRFNHVTVRVSYPEYASDINFKYTLEGYIDQWIYAGNRDDITFQNLPYGSYIFRIKPEMETSDAELAIEFTIKPPWIKSTMAQLVYFVFAVFLVGLFIYFNRDKIRRIHLKHEMERKRLLEIEAAKNEKRLIELRNENLRNEIKLRNNRLAKSTFSLIHKNNTLISVKDELNRIKKELDARFPAKYFKRVIRIIDSDISSEKDWKMFEESFSEVHEKFLHKLKEQYPELTPADIQLCAYLKMNLSSKEIASLLNITVRGVEIRRYRLRKKLYLKHETNLTEFIMDY